MSLVWLNIDMNVAMERYKARKKEEEERTREEWRIHQKELVKAQEELLSINRHLHIRGASSEQYLQMCHEIGQRYPTIRFAVTFGNYQRKDWFPDSGWKIIVLTALNR